MMNRLSARLRKTPIPKRLRRSFLLMSLVSIIVAGLAGALLVYHTMEKKAVAHSYSITGQIIRSVTSYLDDSLQRLDRAARDSIVLADLRAYDDASFGEQEQMENRIRLIFANLFGSDRSVDTVELATPRGTRFYFHTPITSGEAASPLYQSLPGGGALHWAVAPKETALDDETYILLSKKLVLEDEDAGAIFVSLRRNYLDDACRDSDATGSGYVVITDEGGVIVSHPDSALVGTSLPEALLAKLPLEGESVRIGSQLYVGERLPANGWLILNVLSYPELMQGAVRLLLIIAAVCAGLIVLSQLVAAQVTGSISEPIGRLVQAMRSDTPLATAPTTGAKDEYEELTRGFNRMVGRITTLIEDDYQAELKNRELKVRRSEAERSSLQEQINPHFLYNTLETIYWSGQLEGNEEISQMITALGNYFRSIISKGREYIPLRQEIASVDNYLFLQNKRFSERIRISWDVAEQCLEAHIVKLTFQPIVEDIISYSVEHSDGPVEISIAITAENRLQAAITGQSVALLLASPKAKRPGEKNVHQRLTLYFGAPCGIAPLHRGPGGGLCITMPLLWAVPEGGE